MEKSPGCQGGIFGIDPADVGEEKTCREESCGANLEF
jgi:hypothetical protein